MKENELSELAVSLVEEIEAALLRETAVNNEALRELYRTAHAGLSRMLGRDPADQARISDLDEVRALLERAQASLDDSERALEEDMQGELLRAVLSLRDGVLDSLRIAPLARAFSAQQPFATSAGSPAVFEPGAVAPPRALTRPPAWTAALWRSPSPNRRSAWRGSSSSEWAKTRSRTSVYSGAFVDCMSRNAGWMLKTSSAGCCAISMRSGLSTVRFTRTSRRSVCLLRLTAI